MAKEFISRIITSSQKNKQKSLANKLMTQTVKLSTKTTFKTMAALGNIHNIRIVRFLLVVCVATLTIFIYATYSSNGPLIPPPQPQAIRSILDGGIVQMPQQLITTSNRSIDAALVPFENSASGGGDHSQGVSGVGSSGDLMLLKLNRKAAIISGIGAGTATNFGAAKLPSSNISKKHHQHREPTIDVDAVNDEAPDDDELERFGNELMEDGEVQNIDNALVGSINNSNTSSAQQNYGGAPQEQSKSQSQGQLDSQKQANSPDKILDTDVMIPTTNLQKFIENADRILKNITTSNDKSGGKLLSRLNVAPDKNENANRKKLLKENEKFKTSKDESGGGGVEDFINDDEALPPSVVMTIKRPGNNVQQPQEQQQQSQQQPPKQQPQQQTQKQQQPHIKQPQNQTPQKLLPDTHALPKIKTPINQSTPTNNNTDHTKGIPLKEYYESGHLNEEINFAKVCPKNGEELKLLILISSAPTHGDARLSIRQTWAHYGTRRDVSIAFVLGRTTNQTIHKELSIENFIYSDMIRGNFIDSYSNLTLKTVSTLEWVDQHCRQANFILKTDDDMFINVPKLLQFIDSHAKQKRVIYGRLAKQWKPIRNKKSKYYVSTEQFSQPLFPPFTTGPAYLLTNDIIHPLYERSLQQVYLKLEDVFTTGIVAQQLGIKRVHANEFLNRRIAFNPCNIRKLISVHMVKSNEQFDLWKKLLDKSTKCK